jgi:hypothetical protein
MRCEVTMTNLLKLLDLIVIEQPTVRSIVWIAGIDPVYLKVEELEVYRNSFSSEQIASRVLTVIAPGAWR